MINQYLHSFIRAATEFHTPSKHAMLTHNPPIRLKGNLYALSLAPPSHLRTVTA